MEREQLKEMYEKYKLTPSDVFKHQHYIIITRSGIQKIQAIENIEIIYEVVSCLPNFAAVKALSRKQDDSGKFADDYIEVQTFGSALYGGKEQRDVNGVKKWINTGNTTSWYIMEMAEKRAMSRAVLKITGLYEMGVFGQDESEEFKKP